MENSKNSNYNELIQTLIAEFVATANSWGDAVSGYLKSPHSKSITIEDWNTFIDLMQQTLYYVMATRRALSQLSKVGELLEEHVSITSLSVSDDGILTVELGSGDKKEVSGALQRIRINDGLNWEYTIDGGATWKSFGVRAVPYLKILENNNWAYSEDGQKWTDLGISAKGPKGDTGAIGKPFFISKTFKSIEEMTASWKTDGVAFGSYVAISTNAEYGNNAEVYLKTEEGYSFVVDLSGKTGIQGPPAVRGVDYWTDADKAEIQNYVKTAILNGKW